MLVLTVADAHIPERANEIPQEFQKLLIPGRISEILNAGNISEHVVDTYLAPVTSKITSVQGEFDAEGPLCKVLQIGGMRIGIVSAFCIVPNDDPDALLTEARRIDVDILIWGGSHHLETFELGGKFFVNPGSITGAFTSVSDTVLPSFCLLDIRENVCVIYIYTLHDSGVKVERVMYHPEQ